MKRATAGEHTEVGMFLRGALAQAGLDISEGAAAIGFSRSKLSAILNGNQNASLSDIYVFAFKLGERSGMKVRQ